MPAEQGGGFPREKPAAPGPKAVEEKCRRLWGTRSSLDDSRRVVAPPTPAKSADDPSRAHADFPRVGCGGAFRCAGVSRSCCAGGWAAWLYRFAVPPPAVLAIPPHAFRATTPCGFVPVPLASGSFLARPQAGSSLIERPSGLVRARCGMESHIPRQPSKTPAVTGCACRSNHKRSYATHPLARTSPFGGTTRGLGSRRRVHRI